jgi:hypothetical protein
MYIILHETVSSSKDCTLLFPLTVVTLLNTVFSRKVSHTLERKWGKISKQHSEHWSVLGTGKYSCTAVKALFATSHPVSYIKSMSTGHVTLLIE